MGWGMCPKHYQRWKKYGTAEKQDLAIPIEDRFWAKVEKTETCWIWTNGVNTSGYGSFWDGTKRPNGRPRMASAHVWAYRHFVGPQGGLDTLHRCDTPRCVNYERCLFLGTRADNNRDRAEKGRSARGETHPHVKLTEVQAREIIQMYRAGGQTHAGLAQQFDVSKSTIGHLITGRTWAHIH